MISSLLSTELQTVVCLVPPLAGFAMHMNSIYLKGLGITFLAVSKCCWYDFFSSLLLLFPSFRNIQSILDRLRSSWVSFLLSWKMISYRR